MIEFIHDGTDDHHAEAGPESEHGKARTLVVGLGHAGINIVDQIVMRGWETCWGVDIVALDADSTSIDGSVAPDKRMLGASLCRGLGCFGDPGRARALWKAESAPILERVAAANDVVLTVGLGGGTGATFAVEIAKAVRQRPTPGRAVAVCTMPFGFEAETRQAHARYVLAELRRHCDAVIVFSNDRVDVWPEAAESIRKGLHALNLSLARAVEAVAQILATGGMSPLDFGDLRSLFGRFGGDEATTENCWIGRGEAATAEDASALVERALSSPLLASGGAWNGADSCLACITGGPEFSVTQLKAVTKALEKAFAAKGVNQIRLAVGARSVEHQEGRLGLSLLLAATRPAEVSVEKAQPAAAPEVEAPAPAPVARPVTVRVVSVQAQEVEVPAAAAPALQAKVVPAPVVEVEVEAEAEAEVESAAMPVSRVEAKPAAAPAGATASRRSAKPVKQEELPFDAGSRGRFEDSIETIHRGENLDQPTFRRKRIPVKA
jgi:cell division protein FtsZ